MANINILMKGPGKGNLLSIPGVIDPELEADFALRNSQPGVVWYHNFASSDEVDAFRWAGGVGNDPNDVGKPNTITRNTSDGITGGACLEMLRPTGTTEGSVWWRPLSPLDTGSGKTVDDPGANGTISVETWAASQGGSQTANWVGGVYGHTDYWAGSPGEFDGHDYWFQMRVKVDPRRRSQADGGKLLYFSRTDQSLTSQELVCRSMEDGNVPGKPFDFFSIYRSGSPPLVNDDPGPQNQVNGEMGLCDWPGTLGGCWYYSEGWDTLLFHIVPMKSSDNLTWVQIWAQKPGETKWTRIWDQKNVDLPFSTPEGHNAIICSGYQNGNSYTEFYQRWDELIFSKDPIAMPRTTKTVIQTAADALSEGGETTLADNPEQAELDVQWQTSTIYFDPIRNQVQYMGKAASSQNDDFMHYIFDADSNTWSEPFKPVWVGSGSTGHIWCHAFDPIEGNYYTGHYNRSQVRKFNPATASTAASWTLLPDTAVNMGGSGAGRTLHDGTAPIYGWHPNLFGAGLPGLFVMNIYGRSFAYNPADDTWKLLQENGTQADPIGGRNNGQMVYIPAIDSLALFSQHNEGSSFNYTLWIAAGVGNATNAVDERYITVGDTLHPTLIAGKGGTTKTGKVVSHPEDPNRLLLLVQNDTDQVYDSTDYGNTWVERTSGTHPGRWQHDFSSMSSNGSGAPFTVGSLPNQKCVMAISSSSSGGEIRIWKPGL